MARWLRVSLALALLGSFTVAGFGLGVLAHQRAWAIYTRPAQLVKRWRGHSESDIPSEDSAQRFRRTDEHGAGVALNELASAGGSLERRIRSLEALGYASGTQRASAEAGSGVQAQPSTALDGMFLVTDGQAPVAWLMDASGKTLHRWQRSFDDAFPGNQVPDDTRGIGSFRRAYLLPGGELLAIFEGQGLIKLDASSKLLWAYPGRAHHDLEVQPDGTLLVLTREAHLRKDISSDKPILEDFVTRLSPDGKVLHSFSVLEALRKSPYRSLVQTSKLAGDLFHTNAIKVLHGELTAKNPAFAEGNILLSLRQIHALIVVDSRTEQAVWGVAGLSFGQHDPTVLPNGNLLLFDNEGDLGKSRVIELDVATERITWQYSGREHDMHSETCGLAQRLPSGLTLITESDPGRAFIVTPDGHKVWQYVTPHRTGPGNEYIATLFQVAYLSKPSDTSWMRAN